jgi:hypothetical protein
MADLVVAKPARFVPRGSAGDDPAVASRWVSGLLALEIPRSTGPADGRELAPSFMYAEPQYGTRISRNFIPCAPGAGIWELFLPRLHDC